MRAKGLNEHTVTAYTVYAYIYMYVYTEYMYILVNLHVRLVLCCTFQSGVDSSESTKRKGPKPKVHYNDHACTLYIDCVYTCITKGLSQ